MSESSDDAGVSIDVPYSQKEEWKDIVPIEQNDGPNDIVRIAYTETFKEVFGYLRAIIKKNEISERAFQLTKDAALLNPANYTVWYYRRLLIKALNKSLKDELQFIREVIEDNPKNYQVWQHRRSIIELLQDPSEELDFTKRILKKDAKNYHAWQYRQYILKTFDLWNDEVNYLEELIKADIRNNSAWNQRYFVINNTQDTSDVSCINNELNFCMSKLKLVVDNESVWNYLRAFIKNLSTYPQEFVQFCFKLYENEDERSPFLLAFLIDYHESEIKNELVKQGNIDSDKVKYHVNEGSSLIDQLAVKYDVIREKYWYYIKSKWIKNYSKYTTTTTATTTTTTKN